MSPGPVQFMEEEATSTRAVSVRKGGITAWLVANSGGALKDEKQASVFLLGCSVVLLALAAFVLLDGMRGPEPLDTSTIREIIQNQQGVSPPSG